MANAQKEGVAPVADGSNKEEGNNVEGSNDQNNDNFIISRNINNPDNNNAVVEEIIASEY
jgi:hypothetical protein